MDVGVGGEASACGCVDGCRRESLSDEREGISTTSIPQDIPSRRQVYSVKHGYLIMRPT
jgi:hypothetical protein